MVLGIPDCKARLLPYDPQWALEARRTIEALRKLLGDLAADFQHVGSTSVPGLTAKPVIDIAVGVSSLESVVEREALLRENGFHYRPWTRKETELLLACRDEEREMDTHYIHVVLYGCPQWRHYIRFRDALRSSEALRLEYEELKIGLARTMGEDRVKYTAGKAEFIGRVLKDG